jgi:hypothetical protein
MRDDMRYILMDKPRFYSRTRRWRRKQRKGYRRAWSDYARKDAMPPREPMRERISPCRSRPGLGGDIASFNPLVRFLLSRVGQDWRAVWAEICHTLPKGSLLRRRVMEWCRPSGQMWGWSTVTGTDQRLDEFGPHGSPAGWTCRWLFWVDRRTGQLRARRPGDDRER